MANKKIKKKIEQTPQSLKPVQKSKNPKEAQNSEDKKTELEIVALKNKIVATTNKNIEKDIEQLKHKISSAAKSMTSIPKPLKHLNPHFEELRKFFDGYQNPPNFLADIISCLAMVSSEEENLYCLKYKLQSNNDDISLWGDDYIRHLSREIIAESKKRRENIIESSKITSIAKKIVDFYFKNAAEAEAVDLLVEIGRLDILLEKSDKESAPRIASYLFQCLHYIPSEMEDFEKMAKTAFELHARCGNYSEALLIALIANDDELINKALNSCKTDIEKLQLSYMVGLTRNASGYENLSVSEKMVSAAGNEDLGNWFDLLAKELSVMEPKKMEDIYKSHLIDRSTFGKYEKTIQTSSQNLNSARENLATTFANAIVHAGFGNDTLVSPEDSDWVFKNRDRGKASAVASIGLVNMWKLEKGFQAVDRFSESVDEELKAGSLLGFSLVGCGIKSDLDASAALLADHLESESDLLKTFAVIGLGISLAGTNDEEYIAALDKAASDRTKPEICAFACLSLGLIFAGSCRDEAVEVILDSLIHFSSHEIQKEQFLFMALGLSFVFIGSCEKSEGICEALEVLKPEKAKLVRLAVQVVAHAGSNNVLQFHEVLDQIKSFVSKREADANEETVSMISVIGLALIAMGDKISRQMAYRVFDDILRYESIQVRRAVPTALALLFTSNPDFAVLQLLSKLSHDADAALSLNAILALGIVAAGTNNSRVAKTLRNLAVYYQKDADHLFVARVAQGLVHCGKGLISLNPLLFDGTALNKTALAGLLTVLVSSVDAKKSILGGKHYLLYYLALAMRPRMLVTVDEHLKLLRVPVRVGQAVDSQRLAGESKAITGFQTHRSPVLLSAGEKAEFVNKKYIAASKLLEGVVILRKNPEFENDEDEEMSDE